MINIYDRDVEKYLEKIHLKKNLSYLESLNLFRKIIKDNVNESQIRSILVGLASKGEAIEEILALTNFLKEESIRITPKVKGELIDTCGTGGSKFRTFNVSTAAAIIASASGCNIAKHGNKTSSGFCGSADFLEAIGIDPIKASENSSKSIEKIGIGFLFAPFFHPILKNVSKIRKSLGIRTIFNIAGPLCNPCTNLTGQLLGVYDITLHQKFSEIARSQSDKRFIIVNSVDGFDELTNTGLNYISLVENGKINNMEINPLNYGIPITNVETIVIKDKEQSIQLTLEAIYGVARKEIEDVLIMNSAASLLISNVSKSFKEGLEISRETIRREEGRRKLKNIVNSYGDIKILQEIEEKFNLM
ncbi:MAG: anthranilate phosphoribosyltransferase [Nitrososphaeraceae archaeon]